jgi:hypothetical protein
MRKSALSILHFFFSSCFMSETLANWHIANNVFSSLYNDRSKNRSIILYFFLQKDLITCDCLDKISNIRQVANERSSENKEKRSFFILEKKINFILCSLMWVFWNRLRACITILSLTRHGEKVEDKKKRRE